LATVFWTFLAGIFAGLAIITRMSELIWLIPAVGLIWLFYSRRFGFIKLFLFFSWYILNTYSPYLFTIVFYMISLAWWL
jgi:hypothetical protein